MVSGPFLPPMIKLKGVEQELVVEVAVIEERGLEDEEG